jgi:hypothetical protein
MPRNPDGSISIRTIGDHIDHDHRISAHCSDCRRSTRLDLEALAARLGRDHGARVKDLAPKLKCSGCGSKAITFTVSPGGTWDGGGAHSLSTGKAPGSQ